MMSRCGRGCNTSTTGQYRVEPGAAQEIRENLCATMARILMSGVNMSRSAVMFDQQMGHCPAPSLRPICRPSLRHGRHLKLLVLCHPNLYVLHISLCTQEQTQTTTVSRCWSSLAMSRVKFSKSEQPTLVNPNVLLTSHAS